MANETLTTDKLVAIMTAAHETILERKINLLEAIMACGIRVQYNNLITRNAALLVVGSDYSEAIEAVRRKAEVRAATNRSYSSRNAT
jgi:hypothetical protein